MTSGSRTSATPAARTSTTTISEADTPAARRAKRERRRGIGAGLILAGIVAAALAAFALVLVETTLFTGDGLVACGSAVSPVPGGGASCASALRDPALVGGGFAALAVVLVTVGVVLLARTPRSLTA
jgi:hypothetical protein